MVKETAKIKRLSPLISLKKARINSQEVTKNDIFFAIKGNKIDGNKFISVAIKKGSRIIITEQKVKDFQNGILFIHTKNIRKLLTEV